MDILKKLEELYSWEGQDKLAILQLAYEIQREGVRFENPPTAIEELGKMLTASTVKDKARLVAIRNRLCAIIERIV